MDFLYNYIAIEGNIGSGKTTLSTMLAKKYNARLVLEQFEDNPFLEKFYSNQERYAFSLELSFLAERYQQLKSESANLDMFHSLTISDYFIHKSLIFARKTLNKDEFQLFYKLFKIMNDNLPKPQLLVHLYLEPKRLLENISKRGRPFEKNITAEYLQKIQDSYMLFLKQQQNLRVLVLNTKSVDFVENKRDFERITQVINKEYPIGITRISFE